MEVEIRKLRELAETAARLGGGILLDWSHRFTAREKRPADLVTEADFASQEAIDNFLRDHCPDHGVLGEEGLHRPASSPYRWVVDPLDGTTNYVHRFPYYAVSVGVEYDGELVAGAIYDPNRDEMFSAGQGRGATMNGEPISVSANATLDEAMCMASLPPRAGHGHPAVERFLTVIEKAQTVQRSGSAALNLCSVAMGRIDAFWSSSLKPWDMAAGVLIVREAGGCVTTMGNDSFSIEQPDLLATNATGLHAQLSELLVAVR